MLSPFLVLLGYGSLIAAQIPIVLQFPVTTQTSFPSPKCTSGVSSSEKFTVNYNFESVERGDLLVVTTEIGVYNLLKFNRINFVDTDPDFNGNHLGLAPHTYPYAAAFSPLTEVVDTILSPQISSISACYIESTLSYFTLKSFWYGCVLPSPYTAGSLPASCNIIATGFDANGKMIAEQVFPFTANGSIIQDQNFGTFSKFDGVRDVAFGVTPVTVAALMDNLIAVLAEEGCEAYYTGSYNNGS